MKNQSEDIELQIEQYLLNQMSRPERVAFEREVATDRGLQEQLEHTRRIMQSVRQNEGAKAFSQNIREVIQDNRAPKRVWLSWGIAASVAIILGVTISLYFFSEGKTNEELVSVYFEVFPDVVTNRAETDSLQALAMEAYNSGNYQHAILHFEQLDHSQNDVFKLYLGISYLSLKDYEKAMDVWLTLDNDVPDNLKSTIKWYKAITVLALDRVEDAKKLLRELAGGTSSLSNDASSLLKELD